MSNDLQRHRIARQIIDAQAHYGYTLTIAGGKLIAGPRAKLSPRMLQIIRAYKSEILMLLPLSKTPLWMIPADARGIEPAGLPPAAPTVRKPRTCPTCRQLITPWGTHLNPGATCDRCNPPAAPPAACKPRTKEKAA